MSQAEYKTLERARRVEARKRERFLEAIRRYIQIREYGWSHTVARVDVIIQYAPSMEDRIRRQFRYRMAKECPPRVKELLDREGPHPSIEVLEELREAYPCL